MERPAFVKVEARQCTACREVKPWDQFYLLAKNKTTGLNAQCKECVLAGQRKYKQGERPLAVSPSPDRPRTPSQPDIPSLPQELFMRMMGVEVQTNQSEANPRLMLAEKMIDFYGSLIKGLLEE